MPHNIVKGFLPQNAHLLKLINVVYVMEIK